MDCNGNRTISGQKALGAACLCLLSWCAQSGEMRLAGTLIGDENSAAIVEDDGLQQRVETGDSLADCQVTRIGADHVLLVCIDGEKRLRLNGDPEKTFDLKDVADTRYAALDRDRIDALIRDRQRLVAEIDLEPVPGPDGRVFGWRIVSLAEGGELAGIGLRAGDVIVAVNQITVNDTLFMSSLSGLSDQGLVNLRLMRGDSPIELSYTLH